MGATSGMLYSRRDPSPLLLEVGKGQLEGRLSGSLLSGHRLCADGQNKRPQHSQSLYWQVCIFEHNLGKLQLIFDWG